MSNLQDANSFVSDLFTSINTYRFTQIYKAIILLLYFVCFNRKTLAIFVKADSIYVKVTNKVTKRAHKRIL